MKSGRGYVTESPTGPHLSITVGGVAMGGQATSGREAVAEVQGAVGDLLVWIDTTGVIAQTLIAADGAMTFDLGVAQGFLRAEIIARANQERLLAEVQKALLTETEDFPAPALDQLSAIRRAITNPVYLQPDP
jgi:hypothetical protein